MQVSAISAFNDNYIWALHDQSHLIVIDPGDAAPVLTFAQSKDLELTAILVTHHHYDHVDGIPSLKQHFPNVEIYGPAAKAIPHQTHILVGQEQLRFTQPACQFKVIATPGHTLNHLTYYGEQGLFCGDTLFNAGCGRLFEGTPEQMMNSLKKLIQLPEKTLIYCAHEYTLNNLKFAQAAEPSNKDIIQAIDEYSFLREKGVPTLPTTIARQKQINPFLRTHSNPLKLKIEKRNETQYHSELALFTALRCWKDQF